MVGPLWLWILNAVCCGVIGAITSSIVDSCKVRRAREASLSTIRLSEEHLRTLRGIMVDVGDWAAVAASDQSLEEIAKMRETIERVIA